MQVATNAHPSPWRYRGYRLSDRYPSYLFRSPRPFLSAESTQIRPICRSLSLSPFLVNLRTSLRRRDNEGCDGLTATTSCRGKIRSWCAISPRRIGPPLLSPDRGVSDEWVNERHPSDWSKRKRLRAVRNVTITRWFCYWILHRYYVWCDRKMII